MEIALDIYKEFDPKKRALLSATKIDFTDPVLSKEPVTNVRYSNPKYRNIKVLTTNSSTLHGVVADHIKNLVSQYPNDKIFIAYNTVKGSLDLCEHLVKEKVTKKTEVKLLCSQASSSLADKYYKELDSEELPAKINFFTSAYFTGFDLQESYHLVSVSGATRPSLALSDKRIKQIAGRSRPGLLSETIIHDFRILGVEDQITKESLLEASRNQADALMCSKKHLSRSPVLSQILDNFKSKVLAFFEDKRLRFVREDKEGNIVCSYLNIDATLEAQRVRKELYQNDSSLTQQLLSDGNKISQELILSDTTVPKSTLNVIDRNKQVEHALDIIRNADKASDLSNHLKFSKLTSLEKNIISEYQKVFNYVDKQRMLKLVEESLIDKKDTRKFKNLMLSADFHIRPAGDMIVDLMDRHFPIQPSGKSSIPKEKLSAIQVKMRLEMLFTQIGTVTSDLEEVRAVRILKTVRKVYKKSENGKVMHTVSGSNPLKIPVIKKRSKVNAEDIFTTYFQY
jgi:hypothetical protein